MKLNHGIGDRIVIGSKTQDEMSTRRGLCGGNLPPFPLESGRQSNTIIGDIQPIGGGFFGSKSAIDDAVFHESEPSP